MSPVELLALTFTWAIIVYSVVLAATHLLLLELAALDLRDTQRSRRSEPPADLFALPLTPPMSVLVPAHNEEAGIIGSVRSLLALNYPEFEVIVVNDGSTDDTVARLSEAFALEPSDRIVQPTLVTAPLRGVYRSRLVPNLVVIDKENGGKADALNMGINAARFPVVCAIDADSILEPDALLKAVQPLVHRPNLTIATGGIIRTANGAKFEGGSLVETGIPRGLLGKFQLVEYLRAFIVGRAGWSRLKSLLIISGAFGVFRRDILLEVGGYRTDTVGEDIELIVRLHRHMRDAGRPYRVEFIPDPVCWTEAPEKLSILRRQRTRWQRGLLDTLMIHRGMLFNRRYGRLGMIGMPYFLAFELLGPVIEIIGIGLTLWLWWAGVLNAANAVLLLAIAVGVGVIISLASVVFEEAAYHRYPRWSQTAMLVAFSVFENFGYRQMVAYWRLVGLWQGLRRKSGWGTMTRVGRLGETESAPDIGPSAYAELRASIAERTREPAEEEVALARAQAAATSAPPVVPPPPAGGGAPPAPRDSTGGGRATDRPRQERTLYSDEACEEFVQGLGETVLPRAQWLFTALGRLGTIESTDLARLIECEPGAVAGRLITPLSRRAADLGLPPPYLSARAPNGRRTWQDTDGIARRMVPIIERELAERDAGNRPDSGGPTPA